MRSEDIPQILDRLEGGFDPEMEEKRKEAFKTKDYKEHRQEAVGRVAGY